MLRSLTRSGQVAFEFVLLVAVLFTAVIIFTSFVRDNFDEVQSDTDYFRLKDVALSVKAELSLAVALEDGYQRAFFVPLTLDGTEYNVSQDAGSIMFSTAEAEYVVSVPPYSGNLTKGNNVIRKVDGQVEVNT
jgi:hypothetical protein